VRATTEKGEHDDLSWTERVTRQTWERAESGKEEKKSLEHRGHGMLGFTLISVSLGMGVEREVGITSVPLFI